MDIDFLYFGDCPGYRETLARLRGVLAERGAAAEIRLIEVTTDDQARALRFLGSPTIRIGGADIEPGADERTDFGLACRAYRQPDGRLAAAAPHHLIAAALRGLVGEG